MNDPNQHNPYQAPSSSSVSATTYSAERTIPQVPISLSPGWCLKQGWKLTTGNFGKILSIIIAPILLGVIASQVLNAVAISIDGVTQETIIIGGQEIIREVANFGITSFILTIVSMTISILINAGVVKNILNLIDGKPTAFADSFSQGNKIVKLFFASALFGLAVFAGLILFILPGIYIFCRHVFFYHAIVDKNVGVFDSFKYSAELTRSSKLNIVALIVLSIIVVIAGVLALLVGLLWAYPVAWIGWVLAYCYMHQGENCIA